MKKYLRIINYIILIIICVIPFFKAYAQTDTILNKARVDKYYISSYYKDAYDIVAVPFNMNKKRAISYSFAAASIGLMFVFDQNIFKFSQKYKDDNTNFVSHHLVEPIGSGIYTGGALVVLYTGGAIFKNQRVKKAALNATKSLVIAYALVQFPKYIFRRVRPIESPDDSWNWFESVDDKSFMSGHTTAAFAVLSSIALEYKQTKWVPIVCYSLAALTGYSRIHDRRHWASDVVGGAFLGYGVASLIHNANNWGIQIYPSVSADNVSVSMNIPIR